MRPTGPMAPGQLGKPVAKSVPPVSGRVKLLNAWAGAPVARTDPAMRASTTAGRLATESSGRTPRATRGRKVVAPGLTDPLAEKRAVGPPSLAIHAHARTNPTQTACD